MLRGTVAFLVLVAFAVLGTELREAFSRRGLRAPAMEGILFLGIPVALGGVALGLSSALSFGLSAVAMASSPSSLEALARERRVRDRDVVGLLKLVMAFAGIPAVLVFTLAAAIVTPLGDLGGGKLPTWHLIFLTTAIGVVVGYSLVVLVRGVFGHIHLLTLAIGTVCLIAGATSVLGLSGLPAAAFAAVCVR